MKLEENDKQMCYGLITTLTFMVGLAIVYIFHSLDGFIPFIISWLSTLWRCFIYPASTWFTPPRKYN